MRRAVAAIAVLVPTLGGAALLVSSGIPSPGGGALDRPSTQLESTRPTYHLHTDHPTYEDAQGLRAEASDVVIGTVQGHDVEVGDSPGVDADGAPLPPTPHTIYRVHVDQSLKSAARAGSQLEVALSGGSTDDADFVLDGGPRLHDGDQAMFFLLRQPDGRFYPLAGGAAVGARQDDGTFALPADVTGSTTQLTATADQMSPSGSSPSSPSTQGAPPASTSGPSRSTQANRPRVPKITAVKRSKNGTLTVKLRAPVGTLHLQAVARSSALASTGRKKRVVVASATTKRKHAGKVTVVLRFQKRAVRVVKQRGSLAIKLQAWTVAAGGQKSNITNRSTRLTRSR